MHSGKLNINLYIFFYFIFFLYFLRYNDPNRSFGFSASSSVNLQSADIQDCTLVSEDNWNCTDELKLSWLLDGQPGWRIGSEAQLESDEYYKNILLL